MDFFDPQKQKRHTIRLAIGYALMGIALILATTILLYQAYGFGLDKEGHVIQNGLVFVSSHPGGADIYINGKKYKDGTNTRMNLPSGQYLVELKRNGYQDWKRVLTVEGGSVQRFDYPFLFSSSLTTTGVKQYAAAPTLNTQSLDRRWLVVGAPEQNTFDLYDLNSKNPVAQTLKISDEILAAGSTSTGWQLVEWGKDNRHALLRRLYDKSGQAGSEYILFDRENPALSQNLSVLFGFTPTSLELKSQAFDQYYLYDQVSGQLFTSTLKQPTPQAYVGGVLAYAAEGDTVAYVTSEAGDPGKVAIRIKQKDDGPFTVRQLPAGSSYLMDMAVYEGELYLAAGASSEGRIALYQDPVGRMKANTKEALAPIQVLKVVSPAEVSFSANKRFVIAENLNQFAVYDAETDRSYAYKVDAAMDAPQAHATWMDGFRLSYVSNGKTAVFDFDGTNLRLLSAASPTYLPAFDRSFRYLYTLDAKNGLTSTALLTKEDL